jgi:hypothetical protein
MMNQTPYLIVWCLSFVLLVFTSGCTPQKELPSINPQNNGQQKLEKKSEPAGNQADEEEKDQQSREDGDKNEKDGDGDGDKD